MALDKNTLALSIATAFTETHGQPAQQEDTDLAVKLADAIDVYVKGAVVSTPDTFTGTLS